MPDDTPLPGRPLDDVRRKLARARAKVEELNDQLLAYDLRETMQVTRESNPLTGETGNRFHVLEAPSPEWGLDVGEIAYHARSSLDQIVAQLVVANGGTIESHRGSFLIRIDRTMYANKRRAELKGVSPAAAEIIDALQPFEAEENQERHPLHLLDKACNYDKHRVVHPTLHALRSSAFIYMSKLEQSTRVFLYDEAGGYRSAARGGPLTDGQWIGNLFSGAQEDRIADSLATTGAVEHPGDTFGHLLRVGVAFGPANLFVFDLRNIIDFIEERVIARLAPFIERR